MRIPRVFINEPLSAKARLDLSAETSHYLLKVLRMGEGRELIAFDGRGGQYSAKIVSASKKAATIETGEHDSNDRESPLATSLAIGISRGERFDWVLQKATELGVSKITPIFSDRCEVKLQGERLQKKWDHWKQITISACEQCQRNRLPVLEQAKSLGDYFKAETAECKFVLHHRGQDSLKDQSTPHSVALLIGPEGGLTELEITDALDSGFSALTLGPRVLRTETAPVTALSILQWQWGDF